MQVWIRSIVSPWSQWIAIGTVGLSAPAASMIALRYRMFAYLRAPLQISKGARKYANIRYLKAIIDAAGADNPTVPIAIHCDHGDTIDLIQTCINDGYTSVMIDGSHHPYEENVKLSADAV